MAIHVTKPALVEAFISSCIASILLPEESWHNIQLEFLLLFFTVAAMAIEQSPEEMARWYRDMCKRLKREAEEPLLHFYCFVLLKNEQNLQRQATITKYQHPM
ncbi:hypothetical protein Peur_054704 [Populus x canadensis]